MLTASLYLFMIIFKVNGHIFSRSNSTCSFFAALVNGGHIFNPTALRKAKTVCKFGLSVCNMVRERILKVANPFLLKKTPSWQGYVFQGKLTGSHKMFFSFITRPVCKQDSLPDMALPVM